MAGRRVQLVHWNAAETAERAARLREAGYVVASGTPDGPAAMASIERRPPDAVVIDLGRLPSHGRSLATFMRQRKKTRALPIVFVGGAPEKVARVRAELPDAVYTSWSRIRSALRRALSHPPAAPVVPPDEMQRYAGTPLLRKLGIVSGTTLCLVGAPPGFDDALGELPDGVVVRRQLRGRFRRILWFNRAGREIERRVGRVAEALDEKGGVWIAWPKKASSVATDLTQAVVRRIGLASGLVDYKICSIDDTWSGLLFRVRR